MKRPILYPLISFCLGITIANLLQIPIVQALFLSALFSGLSIISLKNKLLSHSNLYLAIIFLGIAYYGNSNILPPDHIANHVAKQPEKIYLKGIIIDDPVDSPSYYSRQKTSFTLKASLLKENGDWQKTSGLVRVDVYHDRAKALAFGDEIIAEGLISKPSGLKNPGSFNYSEYLETKNIYAILKVKEGSVLEIVKKRDMSYVKKAAYVLRHAIRNSLAKYLKDPYRSFSTEIIIGDRSTLKESLKEDFIKTGTIHILAISGLNVGLIAALILGAFGLAGIPKKLNLILTLSVLIVYSFVAGASPPIMRATIIYTVFAIGYLLKRDADNLNSLAIAAVLMLLWNPKELFDPSFQLSFVSVASIIVLYPKLKAIKGSASYLEKGVWVSTAAWIGAWPVVAAYFNIVSPVSLIANIIIIPLSFAVMIICFTFLFASMISSFLAGIIAGGLCLVEEAIFFINHFLARWPFAYFRIGTPSAGFLIAYYFFLLLFIMPMPIRLGRIKIGMKEGIMALLLISNVLVWKGDMNSRKNGMEAVFFDVGEGDSIFMKLPHGENVLIDGGLARNDAFDAGRSVIAPYLWNSGVSYIDAVIVTHFHDDHLGGLLYILKNFKIGCIIDSGAIVQKSNIYNKYLEIIKRQRIRRIVIGEGDVIDFGAGAKFYVLNPPKDAHLPDSNDNSVVLKFMYRNFSILLCGDVTAKPMERLVAAYGDFLKSYIIKIPHHGGGLGNESVAEAFFKTVSPKVSIISGGKSNYYADYKTTENGAVTASLNSRGLDVKAFCK